MRVLIAEDDATSRRILKKAIERSGHECLAARDGLEAWDLFQSTSEADVLISDWMMPGLDGLELCRRIRRANRPEYTYFIFLTALVDKEHLLEGMQAGADDYLVKPLDHEQLQARLIAASRVTSLNRELRREIAERKQTEEELQESEERFRDLTNATFEGIVITGEKILDTNRAFARMFGYESSEVIGRSVLDFVPPEYRDLLRRSLSSETEGPYETVGLKRDGTSFDMEVRVKTSSYGGRTVRVTAVRDITERKEAERELREAETRYRTLVENIPAVTYIQEITEPGSNEISSTMYASPQIEAQSGYPPEAFVENPELWVKLLHPADRERVLAEDRRTDETGEPFKMEYRQICRDGKVIWIRDDAVLVRDEEGRPRFWQGVQLDITEQKLAERALKESELRLRTVISNVPVVLFALDRAGVYTLSEGKGLAVLGLEPGEAVGRSVSELYGDRPEILADVDRALAGEEFSEVRELGPRIFEMWYSPLRASTGELSGVIGVATDVTERRRAEGALRRSEAGLAEAQRMAHIGNWEWNLTTDELSWSDEVFRIYGFEPQQFVPTLERLVEIVLPDDRQRLREAIDGALYKGEPYDYEHRIVRADGEERVVHRRAEVVFDEEGEPLRMVGTVQDITERKRAEERLQEANRRLEQLAVLKADFTSMVAHELSTPLAVIRGYADMLAMDKLDAADRSRALDQIQTQTDVLNILDRSTE